MTEPFKIKVYLGEDYPEKTFASLDSIFDWVAKEREAWKWLEQQSKIDKQYQSIKADINQQFMSVLTGVYNRADWLKNNPGSNDPASMVSCFEPYRQKLIIYSKTQSGEYIKKLKTLDETRAIVFLYSFIGKSKEMIQRIPSHVPVPFRVLLEAEMEAVIYKADIKSAGKAFEDSLKATNKALQNKINEYETQQATHQKTLKAHEEEHKSSSSSRQTHFETAMDAFKERFDNLTEIYEKKVQLLAPSRYWKKISKSHSNKIKNLSYIFCGLFFLFIGLMIIGSVVLFKNYHNDQLPHWVIAFIITILIMCVWLLRIVMKILLSYMHRKSDAESRRVMLETYLALTKKDTAGVTEAQRNIMLEALFRPASDGLVKDDALPLSTLELLTKHK